jgi:hypothetical protein
MEVASDIRHRSIETLLCGSFPSPGLDPCMNFALLLKPNLTDRD